MGAAGRARAVSTFAWPVVVDQLEELYADLLDAPVAKLAAAA
jgi:hypothetical protein